MISVFIVDFPIKHGDFPQLCQITRWWHLKLWETNCMVLLIFWPCGDTFNSQRSPRESKLHHGLHLHLGPAPSGQGLHHDLERSTMPCENSRHVGPCPIAMYQSPETWWSFWTWWNVKENRVSVASIQVHVHRVSMLLWWMLCGVRTARRPHFVEISRQKESLQVKHRRVPFFFGDTSLYNIQSWNSI